VWDNSAVTPLERPKEFAAQAFFTEEQAAEYVKHGIDRFRESRGEVEFQTNGEINGIWSGEAKLGPDRRTSIVVDPPDGRLPPLHAGGADAARPASDVDRQAAALTQRLRSQCCPTARRRGGRSPS
jgi:hypothetical protein